MQRSFRADVQGLRALAVLLVAVDHAHIGPFHGGYVGVDVFFVISGFLITGLLLSEAGRAGRISLAGFYARRAKRILPAATVVLLATVLASIVLLSGVQALAAIKDAVWVLFFGANIKFASDGTDYFNGDADPSPFQHYWSLSVEEQFYLVWPLLLFGLCLLVLRAHRRGGRQPSRTTGVERQAGWVILGLVVASIAYSVIDTQLSPITAYFSFFTRAWELGLGALAACWAGSLAGLPRLGRAAISWIGLAAIAVVSLTYSVDTPFPGYAATVPVLATCLLLVGGLPRDGVEPGAVQRLLSVAPMRIIGDWSYSIYLWHWPALVIVAAVWHPLSGWSGLAVVAGAIALSGLTYRYVENPARRAQYFAGRTRRGVLLYPAVVVLVLPLMAGAHASVVRLTGGSGAPISTSNYGAGADAPKPDFDKSPAVALVEASVLAAENGQPVPADLVPDPLDPEPESPPLGDCDYWETSERNLCPMGDLDGSRTMVLVGDSHARQWIPALEQIAEDHGYRAYWLVRLGCPGADVTTWLKSGGANVDCADFQDWAAETVADLQPDLTIVASEANPNRGYVEDGTGEHVTDVDGELEIFRDGVESSLDRLSAESGRTVYIGDPPATTLLARSCLTERGASLSKCLSTQDPLVGRFIEAARAAAKDAGVEYLDPSAWFCVDDRCPAVVGNFVTRRDHAHVTVDYAAQLTPALEQALKVNSAS